MRQRLRLSYFSASNLRICSKLSAPISPPSLLMSFRLIRRRIHRFAKDTSTGTVLQSGSLTEHRNILRTPLRAWELLLPVYMPGLAQFQATGVSSSSTSSQFSTTALQNSPNSENTNIWLPSRIPISHRSRVCQLGLPEIEERV
jgi:hypothetical protein